MHVATSQALQPRLIRGTVVGISHAELYFIPMCLNAIRLLSPCSLDWIWLLHSLDHGEKSPGEPHPFRLA